ncbi:MAG: CpaF family protein [Candidatus Diapherotrites archaeon]|nr:CpaF family protein [Candidatus Diapherotrites archaeon]
MTVIDTYEIDSDQMKVAVDITEGEDFVRRYIVATKDLKPATLALLDNMREKLIKTVAVSPEQVMDSREIEEVKQAFMSKATVLFSKELPKESQETRDYLASYLFHKMFGLGPLEILISDGNLEEVVVNSSKEPVWVYHKDYGWLKTNVSIPSEKEIYNYSTVIARRVDKQITNLNPLLDAHLVTQDRANATLFPVSSQGNTLTIRKFAREPWTITGMIENRTISSEMAAILWLAIQYESNIIVSGGTASGKTSMLGALMPFIQPFHRVISIEDTRELQLPKYMHWVPLTTRGPNVEGKGEVTMLELMVNSLRMRPDRMVVGEIRRNKEAEVLFEAMHTGHSVYATLHAETASQTVNRMMNPPISVHPTMLEAIDLNVVMFRDRRLGFRRVVELAEFMYNDRDQTITANVTHKWSPAGDKIIRTMYSSSGKLFSNIARTTNMDRKEVELDIASKKEVLEWMSKHKVNTVHDVGRVMAQYYLDAEGVYEMARKDTPPKKILEKEFTK